MNDQSTPTSDRKETYEFTPETQKTIAAMLIFDEAGIKDNIEIIRPEMFDNPGLKAIVSIAYGFWKKFDRPITVDEFLQEFEEHLNKQKNVPVEEYWKVAEDVLLQGEKDFDYVKTKALEFAKQQALIRAIMDTADIVQKGKDHNLILEKFQKALAIGTKAEEDDREFESVCATDVVEEEMEWLWHNTIPKAKLSLLTGKPGAGKSFFTMMLAARVSSGTPFPGRFAPHSMEPGQVLILQNEDGMADTCKKRLRWEGADMSQIHFITGTKSRKGKSCLVDLSTDVEQARRKMRELGNVKLLIVDPLSSYVGIRAEMNPHNDQDVREALRPLTDLCEEEKVAIEGIMHMNKKELNDVVSRITGARAWGAVPRVIWMIAEDHADPELRWFLPAKNNTIPKTEKKAAAFGFRIQDNHIVIDPTAEPIAIEEAISAETPDDAKDRRGKLQTAIKFLEEQRAKGTKVIPAREAKEVFPDIPDSTWRRARQKVGGISIEQRADGWYWTITPGK